MTRTCGLGSSEAHATDIHLRCDIDSVSNAQRAGELFRLLQVEFDSGAPADVDSMQR